MPSMSLFLVAIAVAAVIIWVVSVVDILRRPMDTAHTAGWILVVVLVPFLGSILYWALRDPSQDELRSSVGAEADLRGQRPSRPGGGTRPY
jgi:hypothetical protein